MAKELTGQRAMPKSCPKYTLFLLLFSNVVFAECEGLPEPLCIVQNRYNDVDTQLNQTYQRILKKVELNDYQDYLVSKKLIKQTLVDAQRAWISFRDAHCESHYRLFSGGTSRNNDRLECLAELTSARTEQLKKLYVLGNN